MIGYIIAYEDEEGYHYAQDKGDFTPQIEKARVYTKQGVKTASGWTYAAIIRRSLPIKILKVEKTIDILKEQQIPAGVKENLFAGIVW
jgi:hypothetical protein